MQFVIVLITEGIPCNLSAFMSPYQSCGAATCKVLWFDLSFSVDTSRTCIISSLSRLQNHNSMMTCCFQGMERWGIEHFPEIVQCLRSSIYTIASNLDRMRLLLLHCSKEKIPLLPSRFYTCVYTQVTEKCHLFKTLDDNTSDCFAVSICNSARLQ